MKERIDLLLPLRLRRLFMQLLSGLRYHRDATSYRAVQRIGLFLVEVDREIGTARLKAIMRKVERIGGREGITYYASRLDDQSAVCFKLHSVKVSHGHESVAEQMSALKAAFGERKLSFRHLPNAQCHELRWQAIREVVEPVTLPDNTVRMIERFELLAWSSTSAGLIEQLA
jgi:hypothetical protein